MPARVTRNAVLHQKLLSFLEIFSIVKSKVATITMTSKWFVMNFNFGNIRGVLHQIFGRIGASAHNKKMDSIGLNMGCP